MKCLLDTCTFLWLTDQTENLSTEAVAILQDSANDLFLSQISSIEIQIKFNRGKLPLGLPPNEFIRQALEKHHLHYLTLADDSIWALAKLPAIHQDPFDRLLIAQAIHEGLAILSPDQHIHAYPVRTIW